MELVVMTDKNTGFTLIEFMVAIVILMVGMLGMLQGINIAMSKNVESLLRNEAVSVADEIMTRNKVRTFASISTTVANPNWQSVPRTTRGVFKNYSVQKIVTLVTQKNSKEILINVAWNYKNSRKTHSISSVVSTSNAD
jgi:type IV pilus assembly protein PilV